MTRDRKQTDTCPLLISPCGLLPARHVSSILFATRATRHFTCQRVLRRLPARTCTRGSGRPVTFQQRVNETKMVSRQNFLSSWKNILVTFRLLRQCRPNSLLHFWRTEFRHKFVTGFFARQIRTLLWQKLFIADASISTSAILCFIALFR